MPRVNTARKMVESSEHINTEGKVREFTEDHSLPKQKVESTIDSGVIEVASASNIKRNAEGKIISCPTRGKKWLDEMAFMNEEVTVMIHTTTDRNANPIPDVYVNGRVQRFFRGQEQKVKRMFVERLALSRSTIFENVKTKDGNGDDKYVYKPHSAEVYPFTVIGDSPKGQAWLKDLMKQPSE